MDQNEFKEEESNEFKKKLFERLHGISSKFRINYPISPKICYEYPNINAIICQNIINCLVKYPKFYTQTLHLMNKMNLPCPLVPFVREPSLISLNPNIIPEDMSTSESEIGSDTECSKRPLDISPTEVPKPKRLKVKSLLKSIQLNTNTNSEAKIDLNEVFESPVGDKPSNLKNKIRSEKVVLYDRVVVHSRSDFEGFSKILPLNQQQNENESREIVIEEEEIGDFIKREDLEKNRLKMSELKELPIFKNYDKGEKNSRIYLKNLSKKIGESDLKFIYGRYINWSLDEHKNAFDIRLMKEGKMKGQAFISLPNEDLASKALNDTLGYVLDGKPIVVQFARSARPQINKN